MHSSDPNAPKRGLSAYMFFANDNREKVREENPGISFGKSLLDLEWECRCLTSCRPSRQNARRAVEGSERH